MSEIRMRNRWILGISALLCVTNPALLKAQTKSSSDYLYVWTASMDTTQADFLAVFDAGASSPGYGRLITTVPVPGRKNRPHHTEYEMPTDGLLFANGFGSGQTFVFDTKDPAHPRVAAQFGDVAGMMHPHSFIRLPGGNVLATFQMQHDSLGVEPGGIAELTNHGQLVRWTSANAAGVDRGVRPYSAVIIPGLDRIVSTTTDMGTTRMHSDPRHGVVDANCRIHGLANLYIGGAAVFPTAGAVNPTLTLVALSLRLADHLKS